MKNILVFSDGTANDSMGLASKPDFDLPAGGGFSNVLRLYVACRPSKKTGIKETEQVAFYDAGLGSNDDVGDLSARVRSSGMAGFVPRPVYRALSLATGLGITKNIQDCYAYICEQYEPGDRIYLFGFSRGAYTVRSLGGLLGLLGVPRNLRLKSGDKPDAGYIRRRDNAVEAAVEIYKQRADSESEAKAKDARVAAVKAEYMKADPYMIAVFDTVRSLGWVPVQKATEWASNVVERLAPHKFHNHKLGHGVKLAFHAISIDENRAHYAIREWDNDDEAPKEQIVEQHWLPGVHSDIGGSYPDKHDHERDLGRLSLSWMLTRIRQHDRYLRIDDKLLDLTQPDKPRSYHLGKIHDERKWFWKLYPVAHRDASKTTLEPDSPLTRQP